jgi:phosphohistidine phosphatase SixA
MTRLLTISRARLACLLASLLVVMLVGPRPSHAAGDGWALLSRPGAVGLMRHALAPGTGDPAAFRIGDCSTQRNLDARGRDQARATGEAIRAEGIAIDRVLTSQWCRCRDTAELMAVAPVEDFPALNSFFRDRSTRDRQTEEVRAFLAGEPDDRRLLLVTHQVNITALTGRVPRSGEIVVIDVAPDGAVEILGSVLLDP